MKMKKLYLAYGSNLSISQMRYRCPDATIVGTAEIDNYRLLYKGSMTGSYATIEPEKGKKVPVLVWEISRKDEDNLDIYEGFHENGYRFYYKKDMQVEIASLDGNNLGEHTAMVYIMDEKRNHGMPTIHYESILREGYKRFRFDESILDEALAYTYQNIRRKKMAK